MQQLVRAYAGREISTVFEPIKVFHGTSKLPEEFVSNPAAAYVHAIS